MVEGWHARPGKETVSEQAVGAASSITLRNGACLRFGSSQPLDNHLRTWVFQTESEQPRGPLNVATHLNEDVDPYSDDLILTGT